MRYGKARCGTARLFFFQANTEAWSGSARCGEAWPGRAWLGAVRFGLEWPGTVRQGKVNFSEGIPWNMFSKAKQGPIRNIQIKHIGKKSAGKPSPVMSDAKPAVIPMTLNATTSVIPDLAMKF